MGYLSRAQEVVEDWEDRLPALQSLVPDRAPTAVELARGLGWFSILLGAAELFGGRALGRQIGMRDRAPLLRFFGAREIAVGVGLLANPASSTLMWGRVAGDALDIAALVSGLRRRWNPRKGAAGFALASVLLITVLDIAVAQRLDRDG